MCSIAPPQHFCRLAPYTVGSDLMPSALCFLTYTFGCLLALYLFIPLSLSHGNSEFWSLGAEFWIIAFVRYATSIVQTIRLSLGMIADAVCRRVGLGGLGPQRVAVLG